MQKSSIDAQEQLEIVNTKSPVSGDIFIFRKLFDLMPQLGWTAQPDGWVDFYNQGWYQYTGSNYDEMKGWGWQKVHHPDWLAAGMKAWTEAIATGTPCEIEFPLRRHDGVFRWFLTRINPVHNEEGNLVRWVGINTDIQYQKDKEEGERRRSEALKELDRAKNVFFSNISHELRTPLTLMLAPIESLLATTLSEPILLEVKTIHRNCLRLLRLVNTLLDFSRIEAGRYQAQYEPTDLSALTRDLTSLFRSAIEHAGLIYEVDCQQLTEPAYIDREMWEKIVCNLIANAYKFTLKGKISVRVYEESDNFVLSVQDTGSGIPIEEQKNIFKRFYRLKTESARTYEGSGIGLALVNELVCFHSGNASVSSIPNKGATFTVTIPKGYAHLPAACLKLNSSAKNGFACANTMVAEASNWVANDLKPPKSLSAKVSTQTVLIADDNADMLLYMERLLGQFWHVLKASNGDEALKIIEQERPDLLIADVMMPGMNGFQLLKLVRSGSQTKHIPVMLLSARAGQEARVEGLKNGADDYLVKPFSTNELVARINSLLQKRAFSKQLETAVKEHTFALRREQDSLKLLTGKLSRSNQELQQLTSGAAHDLQEPLRTISIVLDRFRENESDSLTDQSKHYINAAIAGAQRMRNLIDDLLLYSRMETEERSLEQTSAQHSLSKAIELLQGPLQEYQGHITVDGTLPTVKSCDRYLRQLFQNLISNAIKYRSAEPPIITVTAQEMDDHWRFKVCDNGIGFEMQYAERIFKIFQRLHSVDKYPGTGIGLTMCKQIVERHGGKIWAESSPGKGCSILFTLPK